MRLDIQSLSERVNFANMADPENVKVLGGLSKADREEFSRVTKSLVLYFGDEVVACQQAEENAALAAAPRGYSLEDLNGLNIGCGDRLVSPYLTPVDIMRKPPAQAIGGEHHALAPSAFLALPDELPFRPNSVDYIIALHMLEHVCDPVTMVLHWLDIVKPGGGIGVVVPDWRYTWDARADSAPYGHKWNSEPELVKTLYSDHWAKKCVLEAISTYDFKISFDFVLRKPGKFEPFSIERLSASKSGRQLFESDMFLGI